MLRAVLCSELLCCLPFACRVLESSRASRGPIGYCGIHLVSTTPTVVPSSSSSSRLVVIVPRRTL